MNELLTVSKRIDRASIRLYAEVSDDYNPIHLDPDFAAASPMKGIIAHGMLSLNLIWQSVRASLGCSGESTVLEVRFLKPVREDDVLTAGGSARIEGGYDAWVKNQRGETVIGGTVSIRQPRQATI